MADQDKIIEIFRPARRSLWFLFFGLALGPAVIFFERDPQGHPLGWAGLSFLCLGVILHRLSLKYTLSSTKIQARAWWGRGPAETVTLARLGGVRPRRGLAGLVAGVAHLEILSLAPDEAGLNLLGQPGHRDLARRIEALAAAARAEEAADGRR
ncbi:MAG: hypothetical protein LBV21_05295 [Candidatus Adiutrix sp.]|jgi:hypothetical protein|nr:hypothetical protein [Candidatus Adiutrix sp.]